MTQKRGTADVLAVREGYRTQTWPALIQECGNSGLSNRGFCRQRGISEQRHRLFTGGDRKGERNCSIRLPVLHPVAAAVLWKTPAHEALETLMPWSREVQKRYNEKPQPETE